MRIGESENFAPSHLSISSAARQGENRRYPRERMRRGLCENGRKSRLQQFAAFFIAAGDMGVTDYASGTTSHPGTPRANIGCKSTNQIECLRGRDVSETPDH